MVSAWVLAYHRQSAPRLDEALTLLCKNVSTKEQLASLNVRIKSDGTGITSSSKRSTLTQSSPNLAMLKSKQKWLPNLHKPAL